jgi:hypothetical protein
MGGFRRVPADVKGVEFGARRFAMGMEVQVRRFAIGAAVFAVAALGACSDDEGGTPASQEAYDETAAELCERYGDTVLIDANTLLAMGESDAAIVSFLRTEYVPNLRAIVRSLNRVGFPAENAAAYSEGLTEVLEALTETDDEVEAYALVDRLRQNAIDSEENPIAKVNAGMDQADIACGRQAPEF